jgi:hypothetical protein
MVESRGQTTMSAAPPPPPPAANVLVAPFKARAEERGHRVQWHHLWFAVRRWKWSSLAIVPSSPKLSSFRVAQELSWVGSYHMPRSVQLFDARGITQDMSGLPLEMLASAGKDENMVVMATDSVFDNEAAIPMVLAADAVLLCIVLERSDFKTTRQTLDLLGSKVIGSLTLPQNLRV